MWHIFRFHEPIGLVDKILVTAMFFLVSACSILDNFNYIPANIMFCYSCNSFEM